MDLWDTPFSTSCLHNFLSREETSKCTFAQSDTSHTATTTSFSDSSIELANDDNSYAEYNPLCPHPILSLTRVTTTVQVVGLDNPSTNSHHHVSSKSITRGELIDTGGNFNMTN
jgi:hypothetical protein